MKGYMILFEQLYPQRDDRVCENRKWPLLCANYVSAHVMRTSQHSPYPHYPSRWKNKWGRVRGWGRVSFPSLWKYWLVLSQQLRSTSLLYRLDPLLTYRLYFIVLPLFSYSVLCITKWFDFLLVSLSLSMLRWIVLAGHLGINVPEERMSEPVIRHTQWRSLAANDLGMIRIRLCSCTM